MRRVPDVRPAHEVVQRSEKARFKQFALMIGWALRLYCHEEEAWNSDRIVTF